MILQSRCGDAEQNMPKWQSSLPPPSHLKNCPAVTSVECTSTGAFPTFPCHSTDLQKIEAPPQHIVDAAPLGEVLSRLQQLLAMTQAQKVALVDICVQADGRRPA